MSDAKQDKNQLAESMAVFLNKHGAEEAGKLLCRFLLTVAHASNPSEIQFTDKMGQVQIRALAISNKTLH
ncbi:hypothetical protein [Marinobacterium aestuariivivens]|uniref:Uncharacterized protein n=1 Tax=Marinobacterium aestuariivivens TaxID=1698799 RepID=A0ABW2A938_9GAMM